MNSTRFALDFRHRLGRCGQPSAHRRVCLAGAACIAVLLLVACSEVDPTADAMRVVEQAHENCFLPDGSGNPPVGDDDEDGFCNDEDTCPFIANNQIEDADGDGVGDRCDPCFGDESLGDADIDGFCADVDCDDRNKDVFPGAPELCDGVRNDCDVPGLPDDEGDTDGDGVPDCRDRCEGADGFGDRDGDGICGDIDPCLGDNATGDADGDGICGDRDLCVGDDATGDADGDGVCDDRDACEGDDATGDADRDGYCADLDCADNDDTRYPGAPERCNGRDDDCDSIIDDAPTTLCEPGLVCAAAMCTPLRPCYADRDGDGFGDSANVLLVEPDVDCSLQGRVDNGDDCDDDPDACGAACAPDLTEACDGVDRDCDGRPDNDGDALCDDAPNARTVCRVDTCVDTCLPGFAADASGACMDIDECAGEEPPVCGALAECVNAPGTAGCACVEGAVDRDGGAEACEAVCGDGLVLPTEACDDANDRTGDGCDACGVELGWDCSGPTCTPICGDGTILGEEACDDANATALDGCSDACTVEPEYECEGEPSICVRLAVCGNGIREGAEACDDGDLFADDGCGPGCAVEPGWRCIDTPAGSVCTRSDAPDAGSGADAGDTGDAEPSPSPEERGSGCRAARGGRGAPAGALLGVLLLGWRRRG